MPGTNTWGCISVLHKSGGLIECEAIIERGLKTFIEVGNALVQIRDEKLYEQSGYETFTEYLEQRWQLTRRHAYHLIDAAGIAEDVNRGSQIQLPNERTARALKEYDEDLRPAIAKIAAAKSNSEGHALNSSYIKAVGNVLTDAIRSGHVDLADGEMTAFDAALTVEQLELMQRQRQHIVDRINKKNEQLLRQRLIDSELLSDLLSNGRLHDMLKEYPDAKISAWDK